MELLSGLLRFVEFHHRRRVGAGGEVQDVQAQLQRASQEFSSALSLVRRPWLLVFLLPATRWPVLDLLLSMERHVLSSPTATAQCMQRSSRPSGFEALQPLLQRISYSSWGDDSTAPKVHGFIGSNEVSELLKRAVHELSSEQYAFMLQQGERCRPLAMQQRMVTGLVLLETNVLIAGADPESWFREMEDELRDFVASQDLWQRLLGMPFATYPFFGFWLRLRRLLTHRLDLPFNSVVQLAELFSIALKPAPQGGHAAMSTDMVPWVTAFERLKAFPRKLRNAVVIAAMCWGERMAQRLQLWLRAARKARGALGVLVTCLDTNSLASCIASNAEPDLCVDARAWPKSPMSKILTVAMCVRHGFDVLWLDTDTVVLNDPIPRVARAMQEQKVSQDREMLFSVEADSVNCVNTGAYFMRSSPTTQRYLGHWASLYFGRPASTDQSILYLLLGLLPGMDFNTYAQREGLLAGVRARGLGPLQIPAWGSLDARVDFTVPVEVNYGGVQLGRSHEVAVLHLLESYPTESLINSRYHELRAEGLDVVEEILKGLFDGSNGTTALAFVRENERTWSEVRRDCRFSYNHGR